MIVAENPDSYDLFLETTPRTSNNATTQFLKLAIYFLSNNLLNPFKALEINDELYSWFKMGDNQRLLMGMLSTRIPTIDAVVEGLFLSALRAEDLVFSRTILESGLNPDIILPQLIFNQYGEYKTRVTRTPLQMMVQGTIFV